MAEKETKKKTTKKAAAKPAAKKVTSKKTTTKVAPKKTTPKKTTPKKTTKKSPVLIQDRNEYGKMIIALALIALVLVACYVGYQVKVGNLDFGAVVQTEDEKKFESEYEALNGTATASGVTNITIDVIKDNNVEYITLAEADQKLAEGDGVIYFGYASCAWCRNILPTLLDVVEETELETLYYVNLLDEEGNDLRSVYTLNEKNRPIKEKDATQEYYNILGALSENLSQYVLYTEKGREVEAPEKRLSAPTVVAVKKGEILGVVESTIEMTEKDGGALKAISNEDKENANKAYTELIKKFLNEDEEE